MTLVLVVTPLVVLLAVGVAVARGVSKAVGASN